VKPFHAVFQRVRVAFRAISLRRRFESLAGPAFPPFNPPSLPSATMDGRGGPHRWLLAKMRELFDF